jgi:hypothetical protein
VDDGRGGQETREQLAAMHIHGDIFVVGVRRVRGAFSIGASSSRR